jgi:integrase
MPAETGLPPYVSKDNKTGMYQYFRRPSKGVVGKAFVRSFGTRDKKAVAAKYGPIHAEAEAYIGRLISGRLLPDETLQAQAVRLVEVDTFLRTKGRRETFNGGIATADDFKKRFDSRSTAALKDASEADMNRLYEFMVEIHHASEAARLERVASSATHHEKALREVAPAIAINAKAFTLRAAYEQIWIPAKDRGKNTVVEVGRYVDEFTTLNGALDLKDYTREHWGAWRTDCLAKHGPGPTAFKRFSMMKTIVNETIRAGLFERKNFAGHDVTMRKPKNRKLRNEGWLQDELKEFFSAPVFHGAKDSPHPDADYWIAVIIAHTGARLSEVTGMKVTDVAERHGMQTFFLAKESGKTEDSRRIIPIPKLIIDLGFFRYLATRPKSGALFADVNPKLMSQTYSRIRAEVGIDRKGADIHAFRHHLKTLLEDLGAPDRTNDYITGHAPPGVAGRYGRTLFKNCLEYLDQIDLGVKIPKWKPS